MLQFLLGFTFGNVVGMYLAQNYDIYIVQHIKGGQALVKVLTLDGEIENQIPNLAKKVEEIKKDLEAKKKPPSS